MRSKSIYRSSAGILFFYFFISCTSSPNDFSKYLQSQSIEMTEGLYVIINFKACSSCKEDLLALLKKGGDTQKVTLILMGDKSTLRYYAEKEFQSYRIIKDLENKIVNLFPSSQLSSYIIKVENDKIVYHNEINERIYTDEILMDYFSSVNN